MNLVGWIVRISILALISESVPYLSDPEDLLLVSQDSGQLTCSGSNVSWYNAVDDSVAIGNSSSLTVSTAGSYYCRVVHGNTLLSSCPARVSLAEFVPPSNSENTTISVHRTNDVILSSCQQIHSVPPPTIKWMFNDVMTLPKGTVVLPSGNLLISNLVYKNDLGKYRCIASNNITADEWQSPTITLERGRTGNGEAIVFQNSSLNVTAIVGESVALECAPVGEIYINVTWTPMPSNGLLYNERYGGVLRIDNVALSNEGVYNCSYTWTNQKNTSVVSGSRQYHLAVKDHPKITNLTVDQNSSMAVFNCHATGYPTPRITWNIPSGVMSITDGTTLLVTRLGPEAAGIYQCLISNDIGCDHREISFSVSVTTSSSTSVSSYSSVIDASSAVVTSSILSPTPSSTASDSSTLFLTSHISSSASIDPVSSVISHAFSSSTSIGNTIIFSSSTVDSVAITSSSMISHTPSVVTSHISTSTADVLTLVTTSHTSSSSVVSHSPTSILIATSSSQIFSRTSSTTTIRSVTVDHTSTEMGLSTSTPITTTSATSTSMELSTSSVSPTPSSTPSISSISSSTIVESSTSSIRPAPSSTSSTSSISSSTIVESSTSSISPAPSSTASTSSISSSTIVESSTSSISPAPSSTSSTSSISSSTIVESSTSSISPAPSSTSSTSSISSSTTKVSSTSSVSPTPSSTSSATPTVSPTPSVTSPVTMVTGIEFTWIEGDIVKVHWDPVTNEDILGYKISWDSKIIEPPTAAITATNMSEYEIKLMDNVVTLYIYIWTYNFAGDGPLTPTSIVRPMTNLRCKNTSAYSAQVDWTMLAPVSSYEVTTHCSRTGETMIILIDGEELSSEAKLTLESLEYDCIYAITIKPEGYNDYSLQCIILTAEQHVSVEIPKNQSFVDGFWIHWKLYNFEDIPPDMILIVLHVGNQTWEVTDPFSLSEFVELSITQEKTEISVVITVRNMWTITETLVLTAQPTEPATTDGTIEGNEENSITWIFYVIAFGSVVVVVLLVIIGIAGLKHVQIRRREFDKITNHREKIMASLKHDNNVTNGRSESDPPKYIVV